MAAAGAQAELEVKGMDGSILRPDDVLRNELFTYHQKARGAPAPPLT